MNFRCLVLAALFSILPQLVQAQPRAQAIAYDYSQLYEALNPSIAKIFSDRGSGSGFLISNDGFVVTNHHVVRNSRYLAAQFANGHKVRVNVVLLDPRHNLAILKVHPAVVEGLEPLQLLSEAEDSDVRPGVPVVAFGSPLSQTFLMTQGIVSKVEERVLLGDFLIEPGNSGGPLVNLDGKVIGINTFGERRISGSVRIGTLRQALQSQDFLQYDAVDPSADPLPMLPADRFPTEVLKRKILEPPIDDDSYELDAGRFTITAITPVHIGRVQIREDLLRARNRYERRGKKMDDASLHELDAPFYEWMRDASSLLDYAVTFEVKPDFGNTTGSNWAIFATAISAGLSGTPYFPPRRTLEFKAEFQELRVYRDGELLEPITPGRQVTERSLRQYDLTFIDEAYSGMYVYAPEGFLSGERFRFEVFDAREPSLIHRSIDVDARHELIRQIRADFTLISEEEARAAQIPAPEPQPDLSEPSIWKTNLGVTAELRQLGESISIRFTGDSRLDGIAVELTPDAGGFTASAPGPGCPDALAGWTLSWVGHTWRGSFECPGQTRTSFILTR